METLNHLTYFDLLQCPTPSEAKAFPRITKDMMLMGNVGHLRSYLYIKGGDLRVSIAEWQKEKMVVTAGPADTRFNASIFAM